MTKEEARISLAKLKQYMSGGGVVDRKANEALDMAIKALEEPERAPAMWIDGQCSYCGCDAPAYIIDWKWQKDMDANFCPNCGARMEDDKG